MPNSVSSSDQRRSPLRLAEIFVVFPFRTAVVLSALGLVYLVVSLRQDESPAWLATATAAGVWVLVLASVVRTVIALTAASDSHYNHGARITVTMLGKFFLELPELKRKYLEMRFEDPGSSIRFRFPWQMARSAVSPSLRCIEVLLLLVGAIPSVLIFLTFSLIVGNADAWAPALGQPSFAIAIAFAWVIVILSAVAVLLALIDAVLLLFAESIRPSFVKRAHRVGTWLTSLR